MNTRPFYLSWKSRKFSETQCYAVLFFLLIPASYFIIQLESGNRILFHGIVFSSGFIMFTFFEYIAHRFWMHGKEERHPGKRLELHKHHHTHPTELKITASMRNCLLLANLILVAVACWLDNYFTLFTGFYSGFVSYCFMHVILHKRWAAKLFPALQVSHIHHHCKYPDRCFGICTTRWDQLFNTASPKEIKISERILQFYFGNHDH